MKEFNLNKMLGFYVNRTAFLMSNEISKKFTDKGFYISAQDFGILNLLWNNNGQSIIDISKKMMRDKSTITRRINSLVEKKYLTKEVDSEDKRIIRVYTTDLAYKIKNELINILLDFHKDLLKDENEDDIETTKNVLSRIILKLI